ncbi:shikimate kinase [Roseimicrobium gellanilyticum]|uniref:Shikimate kinase n=1 Tax=Roseimicrobium gellanilyticum TaxID=748857 RepID=A0A366HVP6_9BACT|nr:shikimate kinase [Roseimicrobium gellanilyticum]RBP47565.1 shikimate kinase [Roseimicrobium gellanilyticum]
MRYLVIGCGYIGERVADLLHEAGHDVAGVTHSPESAQRLAAAKPYPVHAFDVSQAAEVQALSEKFGGSPAWVIHCASSSRGGAETYRQVHLAGCNNLRASFPAAKILFTSSTSVYPQTDGSVVTEESDATPDRETSQILRATEELVLAGGGSVARLAGIYGPSRSFVLKSYLEGTATIEGNDGNGRYLNQIHREDAARALVHLTTTAPLGIYNVTDDTPVTQRECYTALSWRFEKLMPPVTEPNTQRKRAWTHKRVSNAKLRSTGFTLSYPSYEEAIAQDPDLVRSIMVQLGGNGAAPSAADASRGCNVILVGLMGSGKSTVGRMVAQSLGFGFADTDHLITDVAGQTIPEIFAAEGEEGFRVRETAALRSLIGRDGLVIATGGGIVTRPENLPLLKQLGFVVWLSADPNVLHRRTAHSHDRPLLKNPDPAGTLRKLHDGRSPLYEQASDMKINTDDFSPQDVAYGVAETARVHFSKASPAPRTHPHS